MQYSKNTNLEIRTTSKVWDLFLIHLKWIIQNLFKWMKLLHILIYIAPSYDVDYVKMAFLMCDDDEDLEQYASNSYVSIFPILDDVDVDEFANQPPKEKCNIV